MSERGFIHDPAAAAQEAAGHIGSRAEIAVFLGSGWNSAASRIGGATKVISMEEVPYFKRPTVPGHSGEIRVIDANGRRVLIFLGRTHLNDGLGIDAVIHGVRTAYVAGCRTFIITNGAGTLNPHWDIGDVAVIMDHDNLTGVTPLVGAQHVSMNDAYSPRLWQIALETHPELKRCTYVQVPGPEYETPAMIRRIRTEHDLGGGAVYGETLKQGLQIGMSTTLEVVALKALPGTETLGLSLVTNYAAGMVTTPPNHKEVLEVGDQNAGKLGELIADLVAKI